MKYIYISCFDHYIIYSYIHTDIIELYLQSKSKLSSLYLLLVFLIVDQMLIYIRY